MRGRPSGWVAAGAWGAPLLRAPTHDPRRAGAVSGLAERIAAPHLSRPTVSAYAPAPSAVATSGMARSGRADTRAAAATRMGAVSPTGRAARAPATGAATGAS